MRILSALVSRATLARVLALLAILALQARAEETPGVLEALAAFPHAQSMERRELQVVDHQIGLGALQKIFGDWEFRDSERLSGTLTRETFQIVDGFAASRVLASMQDLLRERGARELFACEGRACGHAAQWANRVFGQRVLYGRADEQRYRVHALQLQGREWRIVLYAGARTSDRQYLHVDVLEVKPGSDVSGLPGERDSAAQLQE